MNAIYDEHKKVYRVNHTDGTFTTYTPEQYRALNNDETVEEVETVEEEVVIDTPVETTDDTPIETTDDTPVEEETADVVIEPSTVTDDLPVDINPMTDDGLVNIQPTTGGAPVDTQPTTGDFSLGANGTMPVSTTGNTLITNESNLQL